MNLPIKHRKYSPQLIHIGQNRYNKMQNSIVKQAQQAILSLILKTKPPTSTAQGHAIVALYSAEIEKELQYANIIGMLLIDFDRTYKNRFLRLYNLQTLAMCFEIQMYYGFAESYRKIKQNLWAVDYPHGIIAFQFMNSDQAKTFSVKIASGQSPTKEQFKQIQAKNIENAEKQRQQKSFFGKIKNFFEKNDEEPKQQSQVLKVQKGASISVDLKTGVFNTNNLSPQWQSLLHNLNLKSEQLSDPDITNIIMEEVLYTRAQKEAKHTKDHKLNTMVVEARKQKDQYQQQCRKSHVMNLPPPPPPPPLLGPPGIRESISNKKNNLMQQIRNNNIKLKHVETKQGKLDVNLDGFSNNDLNEMGKKMQQRLRLRKEALNRRNQDN